MKNKFLFLLIFLVPAAFAQTGTDEKKKEEDLKIQTGLMATTSLKMGAGSKSALNVNTIDSSPGEEKVAITGGVNNNAGKCNATLINSSKETAYRVRFSVVGLDKRGSRSFNKRFSGTVPAKGKLIKDFDCKEDIGLQLDLKSVEPVK